MNQWKTNIIAGILELIEQVVNDVSTMVGMNESQSIQASSLLDVTHSLWVIQEYQALEGEEKRAKTFTKPNKQSTLSNFSSPVGLDTEDLSSERETGERGQTDVELHCGSGPAGEPEQKMKQSLKSRAFLPMAHSFRGLGWVYAMHKSDKAAGPGGCAVLPNKPDLGIGG
ncbi:hypothetical protein EYF80_005705 [Liparis tanakae]|uniref:Uncharacterized protein n=1 Tax=Liparis tanakae TaxID=230148 RepID=A0A4Z2J1J9_9TELE|nr:hypothetical protein EYF80_005705 [Liparis tanakae]